MRSGVFAVKKKIQLVSMLRDESHRDYLSCVHVNFSPLFTSPSLDVFVREAMTRGSYSSMTDKGNILKGKGMLYNESTNSTNHNKRQLIEMDHIISD